jgi:hypothetical protein
VSNWGRRGALLRPNVHNEGRPACGASLSIVVLGVIVDAIVAINDDSATIYGPFFQSFMIDTADLCFLRKGLGIVRRLPRGIAEVFAVDVMEHVFLRRLPVQEESVRIVSTPRLKQIVGVRAKLIAELGNLCFDFQVTSLLSHLTPNV